MSSQITCAGSDVQSGRISIGLRGAWWAEVEIASDTLPSGAATIKSSGGLELRGTVIGGGVYLQSTHIRLVGGAGKLSTQVLGSYQNAQLRDPLGAILDACGESQSSTIAANVLTVPLPQWTLGSASGVRCLDELAAAASAYLGSAIGWRVLDDGKVWIGAESWPAMSMPGDAVIGDEFPAERRYVIGSATVIAYLGKKLDGVGNVNGVDYWIQPDRIRTWLWT